MPNKVSTSDVVNEKTGSRLAGLLNLANQDFCPWANRYVYWLKEPVGWFVLATLASVLIGCFVSPLGWSIAAGLAVVLVLGLGFPWIAIRTVRCHLHPLDPNLHERDRSFLELTIRNRLPVPIYGMMIEGILSEGSNSIDEDGSLGARNFDTGLAKVPALSEASYRLPFCPEYMGRYPKRTPKIACAFPFNIWTARRDMQTVDDVIVRPLLIPIRGAIEIGGRRLSDIGLGQRPTTSGDFLGVREFQRGDSLKSIHWVQSAKHDRLVVCERGGPQQQSLAIRLSTDCIKASAFESREHVAWRIRIAASLIDVLVSRKIPFNLLIDDQLQPLPRGIESRTRAWDRLAQIPLKSDSVPIQPLSSQPPPGDSIEISSITSDGIDLPPDSVRLVFHKASHQRSGHRRAVQCNLNLDHDIAAQVDNFLSDAEQA